MTFKEKLRQYREAKAISKTELSRRLGVSLTYISMLEIGIRKPPSIERIEQIAKILSLTTKEKNDLVSISAKERIPKIERDILSAQEIHQKMESSLPVQRIPVISWVHANKFEEIHDPFPPGISDEYVYTSIKGKGIFALKVHNDCMEPEFREGDIVIIRPHVDVEQNDYIVVADRDNNEATLKQLKIYGTKRILHPLNPKYQDIDLDHKKRYVIIGKVVAKEKKY